MDKFRVEAHRSGRLDAALLAEPTTALVDKLHLRERLHLKRAALLLFHPDPEVFFTGASVKIGFFRNNVDLLYHDEVRGDLFTQVDEVMDLLFTKYLRAEIGYQGIQRVETFPVPKTALREAILNALIHKDYASGATIQISVYDDNLMLWNAGQLPPDWTVEDLMGKHESKPFNPDIAHVFFRAGMIEAWGRGIERILADCKRAGIPAPELSVKRGGFWVTFPFSPAYLTRIGQGAPSTAQEAPVSGREPAETPAENQQRNQQRTSREPAENQQRNQQSTHRERILALLEAQPEITIPVLADRLGLSLGGVRYHLDRLKSAGRVRHVGSTKAGRWEVLE